MKLNRRALLSGCSAAAIGSIIGTKADAAFFMPSTYKVVTGITSFSRFDIGGGGFVTGIDISPDGLSLACRVDVFGTYIWNPTTSAWTLLNNTVSLPAIVNAGGCECISAPSNSSRIAMYMSDGNLYLSNDRGATFAQYTNFANNPAASNDANHNFRLCGKKMAFDPNDDDVLYVGTPTGLYVTTNGGTTSATFSTVSGITVPTNISNNIQYAIAFDPTQGTTTGQTNVLYVCSNGNGFYKRPTPSGSFSAMSGSPTSIAHFVVAPNTGTIWAADGTNLYKCTTGGTWTTNYASCHAHAIALDPAHTDDSRIAFVTDGTLVGSPSTNLFITSTTGVSWFSAGAIALNGGGITWMGASSEAGYMSAGDIVFHPTISNTLLFAEGIGVWYCNPPTSSGNPTITWTGQTQGIENLVINGVVLSPGISGSALAYCWDRTGYFSTNFGAYGATQIPNNDFSAGWGADYCSSDAKTLVELSIFGTVDISGSSPDGVTWTLFPQAPMIPTFTTTGSTATSSNVLHFGANTIPAWIYPGMTIFDASNGTAFDPGYGVGVVQSTTSSTITVLKNVNSTVNIGDTIKVIDGQGLGGSICASSPTNILVMPSNEAPYLRYTKDGGSTWANAVIPGLPGAFVGDVTYGSKTISNVSPTPTNLANGMVITDWYGIVRGTITNVSGTTVTIDTNATANQTATPFSTQSSIWSFADYTDNHPICADRVTANTFYAYCYTSGLLYSSPNSGDTWSAVNVTPSNIYSTYNIGGFGWLKSVPGNAGHLFFCGGTGTGSFIRSTNAGVTWSSVSGVTNVASVGFGKIKSGQTYPAIFIYGTISGVAGYYRSDDNCATWVPLGSYPLNSPNNCTDISGDMNTYGKFVASFSYYGCFVGTIS
jgi:hypothetical protein